MSPDILLPPDASKASAMRRLRREIFDYALAECDICNAFANSIRCGEGILEVGGSRYDLGGFERIAVISIVKAGHRMAAALSQLLPVEINGIIACSVPPKSAVVGFRYFYGGHPLPNEDSVRAGKAILDLLHGLPERSLVLFLISGGASAIAEKPKNSDLTLSDIVEINRVFVHSGAPIAEINAVRKHFSAIKGGRMAEAAFPAAQLSLLVSDVPDRALDALASGPTTPDSSTVADCYRIARDYDLIGRFPKRVRLIFEDEELSETPKPSDAAFANSRYVTVLSNRSAVEAAMSRAKSLGFTVETDDSCDDWDYARAADHLLERLRSSRQRSSRVCLVSGGEVTVTVGNESGVGGRNQQFALYCADKIAGESIAVLSAGTDGIDGNSPAAGAMVDGTTRARATQHGLDIASAISQFDAFPLLDAIGDALVTGPTGNNVRDLRILLAY